MDIVKEEKDKPDPIPGGNLPEDTSKSELLYLDESNGLVKLDPVTVNDQVDTIIIQKLEEKKKFMITTNGDAIRQSTIEDMQVDETETKNFKRLDDQELEDLELQDDKKNNFKIKYDELLKSIQDANTSSIKSIDLAQQLFATKENGDASEYFLDVSNPLMRAVECLGLTLTALEFIGKTYYGIDAPAASLIKLDDEVKKELPEETIIETAAVLAEENIIYEDEYNNESYDEENFNDNENVDGSENEDQEYTPSDEEKKVKKSKKEPATRKNKKGELCCDKCSYTTKEPRYLKQHKMRHGKGKYQCEQCSFTSHKPYVMKSHLMKIHDVSKIEYIIERENPDKKHYMCQKCHYSSKSMATLENHFELRHIKNDDSKTEEEAAKKKLKEEEEIEEEEENLGGEEYKCSKCDYKTKKKLYYTDHVEGAMRFRKCPWCDAHISTVRSKMFARHIRKKHGFRKMSKTWKCNECGLVLERLELLETHLGKVHQIGPAFHCNKCKYSSFSRMNFKAHIENHESASFPCPECPHIAKSKFRLTKHIYSKHRTAECSECKATFKNKNALFKHKQTEHGMEEGGMKTCCDICGLFLSTAGALAQHKEGQHMNVKIPCEQCDYMANSKSNLYYHISTRHKEETFLCDQCEYSTNRRGNLQQHIKVKHTKLRHKCDLCDASYTSITALRRHDLKHNPTEAKFRCEEPGCDYTTHHIDNFKRHEEKVHQGIRWPCEMCNYVGGYKGDLSKHIKIVHEGFILKCTMCDYTTPKKYYMKGHMLKVHGCEPEATA